MAERVHRSGMVLVGALLCVAFVAPQTVGAADAPPPVANPVAEGAVCYGAPETGSFQDLDGEPESVRDVIACLSAAGLGEGTTATMFSPGEVVTRRQMAAFIKRLGDLLAARSLTSALAELPAYDGSDDFMDVAGESAGVREAIGQLDQAGIVGGFSDGSFRPGETITRRQMAAFVNRLRAFLVGAPFAPSGDFFDDDAGDPGEGDLNALASVGVFAGDGASHVFPGGQLTRRQMANILLRVMQVFFDNSEIRSAFARAGALAFLPRTRLDDLGRVAPDVYDSYAAEPDEASLAVHDGSLTSVIHDTDSEQLLVYRHARESLRTIGGPLIIPTTGWPRWGGHLAARDGTHYVLLGRENPDERADYDTIEVRRYDDRWNLVGSGRFANDSLGVYQPFAGGSPAMTLIDGRLVIHMSRSMFLTGDGLHHQVNLTLIGDADDLALHSYEGRPYASHSFNQLVVAGDDGASLIFVDHGDAYPRGIQSGVVSLADAIDQAPSSTDLVLPFDGDLDDDFYQYTGTSVTGLESLDDGAMIVGSSVRHSGTSTEPVDQTENRNLFVLTIDDSGMRRDLHWLTDFPQHDGATAGDPRLVRLGDDQFVVLFTILDADGSTSLGYRLLDGTGQASGSAVWPNAHLGAISEVVVDGTNLYWVGSDGRPNLPMFVMRIDVTDPRSPVLH